MKTKVFYPKYTDKIWHLGENGNKYRLDVFDNIINLKQNLDRYRDFEIVTIDETDDSVLQTTHSNGLLKSYETGTPKSLAESSGILWQDTLYKWIVNKAWASIFSSLESIKNGRALTLASGGHHAENDRGFGFGPISNMVIACKYLLQNGIAKRVAILDLDVHYANGTHSLVVGEDRILSVDLWKYKLDEWKFTKNRKNIFHTKLENSTDYFSGLKNAFLKIENFKPDLLMLYIGLDVMEFDRMGGIDDFGVNELKIRDNLVYRFIKKHKIPTNIFIGGGYINYNESQSAIRKQKNLIAKLFHQSISTIFPYEVDN